MSMSGQTRGFARIVFLLILAVGLLFRLWDIARPFIGDLSWNEVYYVTIARNFDRYDLLSQYNYGSTPYYASLQPVSTSSPLVPWMVYFASKVFGMAEWVARLPMVILGVSALVILYFMARELYGDGIGLGATFIAAIMPGIVFFSRVVHLDGPMTTFGLAAFLTLLFFERRRRWWWLFASALFFALALLAKYTAVLFLPSLGWVWMRIVRRGTSQEKGRMWVLLGFYFVAAVLPTGAWVVATLGALSPSGTISASGYSGHLSRLGEWNLHNWYSALQITWPMLANHIGRVFWYPLALVITWFLPTRRLLRFARQHLGIVLLTIPWFAQILYPDSWVRNPHYDYPALYGVAIVLALLLREVARWVRQLVDLSDRRQKVSLALLGGLVCLSCLWDYKEVFHTTYFPWYIVTRQDPFYSARLVHSRNASHQSILADLPHTLYYAEGGYGQGKATWWGGRDDRLMIRGIEKKKFDYVVFTYIPTVDIVDAIHRSGYRRIGPAAWEKQDDP